jgi:glucose-1-phosphate thymidylyltransferase
MSLNNRKGIILAGGLGTRLMPSTKAISKQMLTVYDKPMIFYALSVLMLSKIREILIISTQRDISFFQALLNNGEQFGINISYKIQSNPNGIAESFIIARTFIGNDTCALILGDNLFYGSDLPEMLKRASLKENSSIFVYQVRNPSDYGVVQFTDNNKISHIEEKPRSPKSELAVTGLYFYDNDVVNIAKNLNPSKRGELEITDINNIYIKQNKLSVERLSRGHVWLDMGTHDTLLEASNLVAAIQKRQGVLIGSPEEIAFINKWISKEKLGEIISKLGKNQYSEYLKKYLI